MPHVRCLWVCGVFLMLCACTSLAQNERIVLEGSALDMPVVVTPTLVSPTPTPVQPSATPTLEPTPTNIPTPEPTPDPVTGYRIADLREQIYGEGSITIGDFWSSGASYTSYRISYPVDGLQLTGLIHIPNGEGPFPVIIANRGYIEPERYQSGMDSRAFADFMANRGYLVVAPDYRGYGGGDDAPNLFYTGYYVDVLHLIPLAQQLPMARDAKVGMWGHSRGASITIAALTITDQIAAAVVYAPAPADLAADYARRLDREGAVDPRTWPFPPEQDPAAYGRISPINYFDAVAAPVMLHHGTNDSVVDVSASVEIAEALRAAEQDVTLHIYEGSGHTLTGEEEQIYFARTLEFFQTYLGQ
ncbi:MAG: Dipeptidyl aminopeptidase/acylaminoacyl peptidase [Chloroflexi bacterium AL-W]|nr:Dipeptidyl aminopeptidase/acylaminoacyl peptidase [Chloroflexi bacterium AL-N5]NOK85425.1 Dipeptidyl aminopeptidase/acylaminoacyl peptidase [Chloroflexi bacterium AL-W]